MSETQTIGLVQIYKKEHGGLCKNKNPIRGFTECQGTCQSGSKYNPRKYFLVTRKVSLVKIDSFYVIFLLNTVSYGQDKICLCCSIQGYVPINVSLECPNGVKVSKEVSFF